jgi:hypothetical protein
LRQAMGEQGGRGHCGDDWCLHQKDAVRLV